MTKYYADGTPVAGTTYAGRPNKAWICWPKYSKRDYEIFAHMLKRCKPLSSIDNKDLANQAWATVVNAIAELFHEDNPRFDILTFVKRIHEHETVSLEPGACPPWPRDRV